MNTKITIVLLSALLSSVSIAQATDIMFDITANVEAPITLTIKQFEQKSAHNVIELKTITIPVVGSRKIKMPLQKKTTALTLLAKVDFTDLSDKTGDQQEIAVQDQVRISADELEQLKKAQEVHLTINEGVDSEALDVSFEIAE